MVFVTSLFVINAILWMWIAYNVNQWPTATLFTQNNDNAQSIRNNHENAPFVSILVPARNEERGLERCLVSLLEQNYPHFEVICLDDRSTDATPQILERLQTQYPRLSYMTGAELPEGWIGKCHACHQLSQTAKGELLLFTDADTIHQPQMLFAMVNTLLSQNASLVTGFPKVLTTHTFGWLILPMLFFVIVLHLPLRLVTRTLDPRFIAAHGAFMLYRTTDYLAIGGHEAHRDAIVEDMAMAKAIKASKRKAYLVDITPYVACDMYEKPKEVWHGFSKNLFLGVGASTPLLLGLLCFYAFVYVFPLFLSIIAIGTSNYFVSFIAFTCYGWSIWQKYLIDRRFGTHGAWFWLLPISFIGLIAIACRSWFMYTFKKGYTWKGRVYHR
jgi:chlorobactene glucosyltransferase